MCMYRIRTVDQALYNKVGVYYIATSRRIQDFEIKDICLNAVLTFYIQSGLAFTLEQNLAGK